MAAGRRRAVVSVLGDGRAVLGGAVPQGAVDPQVFLGQVQIAVGADGAGVPLLASMWDLDDASQ